MIATKPAAEPWNQGAYLVPDAARILRLPLSVLRSWISGKQEENCRYYPAGKLTTKGVGLDRHFGFHALIELFTIAQLRKRNISMPTIRQTREELMERFETAHPFALEGLMTSGKKLIKSLDEDVLLELGTRGQTAFSKVLEPFCASLDFDQASALASRYYPLGRNQPIVVDPKHAFGRPVIEGTNLTAEAIMALIRGGEAVENIAESFQITTETVLVAKCFEQRKAA
ncbi:MAG: DUF433 domain-containing protein [Luteolibacter sp.]